MTVTELAVAARARAAGGVAVADRSCFSLSRVRRGLRVERVARGSRLIWSRHADGAARGGGVARRLGGVSGVSRRLARAVRLRFSR